MAKNSDATLRKRPTAADSSSPSDPSPSSSPSKSPPKSAPLARLGPLFYLLFLSLFSLLLLGCSKLTSLKAISRTASETPLTRTDVLLSSFPKSGSFWCRFLLAQVDNAVTGAREPVDFASIERQVPDLELGQNRKKFATNPHPNSHRDLRLFKSHQPYMPLSSGVVRGFSESPAREEECDRGVGPGMER